jgi:mannose/fructose/N-acetylgalactosamine-specific phosphotransferase system component IIC
MRTTLCGGFEIDVVSSSLLGLFFCWCGGVRAQLVGALPLAIVTKEGPLYYLYVYLFMIEKYDKTM